MKLKPVDREVLFLASLHVPMSTSLAQQLQALQFAEQHAVAPHRRVSLLFAPEVAARTEPETVRLMAETGLQTLHTHTGALAPFDPLVGQAVYFSLEKN
jgi:hypothetical protein